MVLSLTACLNKKEKLNLKLESKIPEKREFPINADLNACEDFHKYVCSKVEDSFTLPDDRSRWSFSFSDSAERLLDYKKAYFKQLSNVKPRSNREGMLKDYYLACMNEEKWKVDENSYLVSSKDEILAIKDKEEFKKLLDSNVTNAGKFRWYDFFVASNQKDPDVRDLIFDIPLMSFPERSYYENKELLADWEKLLVEFFEILKIENAKEKAKLIVKFEKEFAKVYPTPTEFRQIWVSDNYVERKDYVNYSSLSFANVFSKIPTTTQVRNLMPESFDFINKKVSSMKLDELKAISIYNLLYSVIDDSHPEFYQKKFEFSHKYLGGPKVRPDRQERCTKTLKAKFKMELDSILIDEVFPKFPEQKFIKLAENIRATLLKSVESNTWLSQDARSEAMAKVKKAKLQLVKPSTEKDWNFNPIKKYDPNTPLQNTLVYAQADIDKNLEKLNEKVNHDEWGMGPLTVNAYYSGAANKFVMPIGILQYPFYDASLKDHQNIAAIGTVIGHELGHGIDDKGSRYDSTGKVRMWMETKDLAQFTKKSEPLIKQFDKIGHNGKLTLGENIGDLVGLSFAFDTAFPKGYDENKKKDIQEFFVQYGRAWCGVARPKYIEMQLKSDPHALGWARINEQVKHQQAFEKAFNCKAGDPMTLPDDKRVRIW